jgi:hypothetical protein
MGRIRRRRRAAHAARPSRPRAGWYRRVLPVAAAGLVGVGALAIGGHALLRGRPVSPAAGAAAGVAAGPGDADMLPAEGGQPDALARQQSQAQSAALAANPALAQAQIILPDLLIVAPRGLTRGQEGKLAAIAGVRAMLSFDGAQITLAGHPVNVIGVNPSAFRSWVPVRTASDQPFWTALGQGQFVVADTVGQRLGLKAGSAYRLDGAAAQTLRYGGAARLGMNGVDLLVSQSRSARLGLVHQVAALISAPGVAMSKLTAQVQAILGPSGRMESLRAQQLPAPAPAKGSGPGAGKGAGTGASGSGGTPTTYLQLFQESAARYCPGLPWTVLAAIGQIESADGTNEGPSSAGALGPMQFLPSTWATWGIDGFGQTGTPNIMNPYDAVPSAARLLCADGAARGGAALSSAIFSYNHAEWYVREVLALARAYAADFPG